MSHHEYEDESSSSSESEDNFSNPIEQDGDYFFCNNCNCHMSDVEEHLKDPRHKRLYFQERRERYENRDEVIEDNSQSKTKSIEKSGSSRGNENQRQNNRRTVPTRKSKKQRPVQTHVLNFPLVKENSITCPNVEKDVYDCIPCKCSFQGANQIYTHIVTSLHKQNLEALMNDEKDKNKETSHEIEKAAKKNEFFYCSKCDCYFSMNQTLLDCHCLLHLHYEQPELDNDILQYTFLTDDKINIKCLICNLILRDDKSLAIHLESPNHLQRWDFLTYVNMKRSYGNPTDEDNNVRELESYYFNVDSDIHIRDFCNDCQEPIDFDEKSTINVFRCTTKSAGESQVHKHYSILSTERFGQSFESYKCFLCNKSCTSPKSLLQHFSKDAVHKNRLGLLFSQKLILKSVRYLNYNKLSVLIRNPRTRQRKDDVKFPYNKDLIEFGSDYIAMCLEPGKRNIYKMHPEEYHYMKLGVNLTYPHKNQRICIPCGYEISQELKSLYEHIKLEDHIENIRSMEYYHKEFENCQGQFSDLDLAQSCMMEESEGNIKCFACDANVGNNDEEIKIHMKSGKHIHKMKDWADTSKNINRTFSNILNDYWYYIDRFTCCVCSLPCKKEISFARHLEQPEHLDLVKKMNKQYEMNICLSCSGCWYGEPNYKKHFNSLSHIKMCKGDHNIQPFMKRQAQRLLRTIDRCAESLIQESNALKPNENCQLIESVLSTVQPLFPEAKAYAFGSRSSLLGFSNSDVDVFVDCENIYHSIGSREASQNYIRKVKNNFLEKNKRIWKMEAILLQPRVPIMKLIHKPTGIKCDISFLNGLGVEKSKLIRNYVAAYSGCRKLILFIKKWLDLNELYGSQGINGYAVSWYTIFFLQTLDIVPSVSYLIKARNSTNLVDGWECGFQKHVPVNPRNFSFSNLAQQFFKYYADFNYRTDVACPLVGKVIKKRDFVNVDLLPAEMDIYKQRVKAEEMELFRYDSPMAIQDPVDLSQNITKAVSRKQLRYFKQFCSVSYRQVL